MGEIIAGIFLILHGAVHLLYAGQGAGYFELQPDMVWPARSWLFSRLGEEAMTRRLAVLGCVIAAVGFVAGGIAVLLAQGWRTPVIMGAAVFSTVIFLLFWDGTGRNLDDQGGVGMLINLAILGVLLLVG